MPHSLLLAHGLPKASDLGHTAQTVIAFPYTGDYRVDVLIDGPLQKWSPDIPAGQTRTVTYSFAVSEGYLSGSDYVEERKGFTPFTQAQKVAARTAFDHLSTLLPIRFVEITETTAANTPVGEIRMTNNTQADSAGYAAPPVADDTLFRGDVFLSNEYVGSDFAPGSEDYDTLVHEIAHALGLKHPGNYNAGSEPSTEPGNYLASSEDSKMLSVVSYAEHVDGLQRVDFGPYDLLALQTLYGLQAQNTGNNTYAWTNSIGRQLQTLVDDGGKDTIDLRQITHPTVIDLREGQSSNVGMRLSEGIEVPSRLNVQIAFGTVIEGVIGSDVEDTITGNASPNVLEGRGGNDVLDGAEGLDTAVWSGLRSQYQLQRTSTGFSVQSLSGSEGVDRLQNIERLRFADQSLALDLDGHAGMTAKILGAVFGRTAVGNPQFVGIGLHYLDEVGLDYTGLMQLAINARLGAQPSPDQVVDLLYTHVVGTAPDAASRQSFTQLLDNGTFTVGSLGVLAAETALNQSNINLVGLLETGLAYSPVSG
jgi:serralysin